MSWHLSAALQNPWLLNRYSMSCNHTLQLNRCWRARSFKPWRTNKNESSPTVAFLSSFLATRLYTFVHLRQRTTIDSKKIKDCSSATSARVHQPPNVRWWVERHVGATQFIQSSRLRGAWIEGSKNWAITNSATTLKKTLAGTSVVNTHTGSINTIITAGASSWFEKVSYEPDETLATHKLS